MRHPGNPWLLPRPGIREKSSLPQRNGAIAKIKSACAFVVDDNEVEWRKLQKYLRKTTREAIKLEADANTGS